MKLVTKQCAFLIVVLTTVQFALRAQCVPAPVPNNSCYTTVINNDSYCCNTAWDGICQADYDACMAQNPGGGGSGSGCNVAASICTQGVTQPFSFDQSTPGPPTDFANPVGCSTGLFGNANGFGFILLYITQSGPLNLLVDGNATSGFIDVVVYNIPNGMAPCDAVMNSANEIGCNYATASVGCTQFGNDFPCTSSLPAPNVVAGQVLMVIVHDYSSSSNTYTLNLGPNGAQTGPPDGTIISNGTYCLTDAPFQMTAVDNGGNWTGPGVSQSGMFDPASAGIGSHIISYSIGTAPCSDNDQQTITVIDCTVPCSFSYPQPAYCQSAADPTPTIVGYNATGGTFSSTAGLSINASTGVIDLSASTPGTYTINYVPPASAGCQAVTPVQITINATPNVNAGPDVAYCAGGSANLLATGANSYSWSPTVGLSSSNQASVTASGASTTTYTVTGTTTAGCTNTDQVTVTVNPIPTVNAGPDQTICQGQSVTLTGSGTVGVTFSWNNGVSNGVAFTPSATGTTTYTVTGTTAAGCTATDQVQVTVNSQPNVVVGDVTICSGETIAITATGATNYTWSPPTGLSATTGATVNANPTVTTNYTVTGTDPGGCSSTDNFTVTVSGSAAINAGPDVTLCEGQSTTISATGGATYTWDNGLGNGSSFTITPSSTTTYTVNGLTASGCAGTDQVTVTVNPNPAPVIQGSFNYCTGFPPTLSTSVAYTTYSWSTGSNSATIVGNQGNNPISVTVTNNFGCQTTSAPVNLTESAVITTSSTIEICEGQTAMIHGNNESIAGNYSATNPTTSGCDSTSTITLVVHPLPQINAGVDQNVCDGTATILTANGANSYSWNYGVVNGVAFNQAVGSMTYTVTGTSTFGCQATDDVTINVNALPTIDAGQDQIICAGDPVTLVAQGAGSGTYAWDNGVVNNQAFTPMSTTTYTVVGTDQNGCQNTDDVNVTVNPIPTINAGNDLSGCEGTSFVLTASGAGVGGNYVWDNNVTNGASFVPTPGVVNYTVIGTNAGGCSSSDNVTITVEAAPIVSFNFLQDGNCAPVEVTFTNTTGGNTTNCIWLLDDGTQINGCQSFTHTFNSPGTYGASLQTETMANGCVGMFYDANIIQVDAVPVASFDVENSVLSTVDSEVQCMNSSINATTYQWDFGDENGSTSSQVNPSFTYSNEPGSYSIQLIAISPNDCRDTTARIITIEEELLYFVPNTFTPDGDEFNQTFLPIFVSGLDIYNYSFTVFNRWGEIVFVSKDVLFGWPGTYGVGGEIVQDGVYTWKLEFKTNMKDDRREVTGVVHLIR